jgi:hypothetical protein
VLNVLILSKINAGTFAINLEIKLLKHVQVSTISGFVVLFAITNLRSNGEYKLFQNKVY